MENEIIRAFRREISCSELRLVGLVIAITSDRRWFWYGMFVFSIGVMASDYFERQRKKARTPDPP